MKILQITDSLGNGGAEKFTVELCSELAEKHQVILCSVNHVEDWMQPPRSLSPKVELKVLGLNRNFGLKTLSSIVALIKDTRPDVVHIHASILVFMLYPVSALFKKTFFLQTIHSTLTRGYKKLLDFMNRLRLLNRRFANVCIAGFILQDFTQRYPNLYFEKIDNGIVPMKPGMELGLVKEEIQNYRPGSKTRVFIAIGNYSDLKNFGALAEVFNELNQEGRDVVLLLIGQGREGAAQENYQRVGEIKGGNIHQLGYKKNIADYMTESDALVISSIKEGMPLVALEALSMGVPIVTTPAGGMVDLVRDQENGFMARGFSGKDIKEAVIRLLEADDEHLNQIRVNNRSRFNQHYSIKHCAQNYLNLYKTLVSNRFSRK